MLERHQLLVKEDGRIDKILANEHLLPREAWKKIPHSFRVWWLEDCQGGDSKAKHPILKGSWIGHRGQTIVLEKMLEVVPPIQPIPPEEDDLQILYEDDYLLVVNKPAGQLLYPAHHESGTLVAQFLTHLHHQSNHCFDQSPRPGIVHRLDQDTTGLLILAKDFLTLNRLQRAFANRQVQKIYWAIAYGQINTAKLPLSITFPLGHSVGKGKPHRIVPNGKDAKPATTVVLASYPISTQPNQPAQSLLQIQLETGRTHQIRAHLTTIGNPLVGDSLYQPGAKPNETFALQCAQLTFHHPWTKQELSFTIQPPNTNQWKEIYAQFDHRFCEQVLNFCPPGREWPTGVCLWSNSHPEKLGEPVRG